MFALTLLLSLAAPVCQPGDRALTPTLCLHETVDTTTFECPITFTTVYNPKTPKVALWGMDEGVVIDGNQDYIAVERTRFGNLGGPGTYIQVYIWNGNRYVETRK